MGLNAKKVEGTGGGKRQEPLEQGTYPCRLAQVIDLGNQNQRPFKGEEKPPIDKIMTTYEFLDEFIVDEEGNVDEDKPRVLGEDFPLYNLEADRATSTKRYYALDPEDKADGDWTQLIGTPCMVTITNKESNGKVYNNISAVSAMRAKEAEKAPELKNDSKVFLLDNPNIEVFLSLPEFIQKIVKANNNFSGSELEQKLASNTDATNRDEGTAEDNQAEQEEEDNGEW